MPGEFGGNGRPLLTQRGAGREFSRALGDRCADRRSEADGLASVAQHRTDRRGFDFAIRPPPFFRAASIAARSATLARSTPDSSSPLMPAPRGEAEVQVSEGGLEPYTHAGDARRTAAAVAHTTDTCLSGTAQKTSR
ncbi:hypothetical protein GZL_00974 [Streptomyces sp. 769]|nr:hypothetical protein GZL_00974 [Streptomyces sp. 769]